MSFHHISSWPNQTLVEFFVEQEELEWKQTSCHLEQIDKLFFSIMEERIRQIHMNKRQRRQVGAGRFVRSRKNSTQSDEENESQLVIKQIELATTNKATSRSRPEGMLLYPLPGAADDYMVKIRDIIGQYSWRFMPDQWLAGHYLNIDRALVHYSFAYGDYEQVHRLIGQMCLARQEGMSSIPKLVETELADLWHSASYHLDIRGKRKRIQGSDELGEELQSPGDLSPVRKYRIRAKNPCPTEMGKEHKYKLSKEARSELNRIYLTNKYPTKEEKHNLIEGYGLTPEQISNWFKNKRQRTKVKGLKS